MQNALYTITYAIAPYATPETRSFEAFEYDELIDFYSKLLDEGYDDELIRVSECHEIVQPEDHKPAYPEAISWTRATSDSYGNPRYVCHFLAVADDYPTAVKIANSIGGRKHHTKSYGGGLVFTSYNIEHTERALRTAMAIHRRPVAVDTRNAEEEKFHVYAPNGYDGREYLGEYTAKEIAAITSEKGLYSDAWSKHLKFDRHWLTVISGEIVE